MRKKNKKIRLLLVLLMRRRDFLFSLCRFRLCCGFDCLFATGRAGAKGKENDQTHTKPSIKAAWTPPRP